MLSTRVPLPEAIERLIAVSAGPSVSCTHSRPANEGGFVFRDRSQHHRRGLRRIVLGRDVEARRRRNRRCDAVGDGVVEGTSVSSLAAGV